MNLVLPPLNALLIGLVAYRLARPQPDPLKRLFWSAFGLKLVAGATLGWLYLYQYGSGDTLSFWHDGVRLADEFFARPADTLVFFWDESLRPELYAPFSHQGPRSLFFVKICGALAFISGGNYWIMGAWLSLAAFVCSWIFFIRLDRHFPEMRVAHALIILFLPSVVFWSSGLIKESLGLAALYLMMAGALSVVRRAPLGAVEILFLVLACWVGWSLKYYWLGIFFPVVVPLLLVAWTGRRSKEVVRYDLALWFFLFLAFALAATQLHPNFYVSRFWEVIWQNNQEFTRLSDSGKVIQYPTLEPNAFHILANVPAAIVAGLFRPFAWEAFDTLSWMAALENLFILGVVVQALPALRKVISSEHRLLVVAGLTYAVLLTAFLALSTPNFGTLSRYRIGALPFLLLICLSPATPLGRWLAGRRWFG